MTILRDAQHFLKLRFSLQDKVLRRPATANEDSAFPARSFGSQHYRSRLIHISRHIDPELTAGQGFSRDIHPDRTVTRGGGVDGNTMTISCRQQGFVAQ